MEPFADVDPSADLLPLHIGGAINGETSSPVRIAVAVNGRIAAITSSYLEDGTWSFSTLIPEQFLIPGANDVEALLLDVEEERIRSRRSSKR